MFMIFYFILLYIQFWSEKSKAGLPRRRYTVPIATLMMLIATAVSAPVTWDITLVFAYLVHNST